MYRGISIRSGEPVEGDLINFDKRFFIRKYNPKTFEDNMVEIYEDSISKKIFNNIFENDVIIYDGEKSIACLIDGVPCTLSKIPLDQFKEVKLCRKKISL